MIQLLLHLWGDYITQSDWMAQNKTKAYWPAAIHAILYAFPFMFLAYPAHRIGWWVIFVSHFFIDRFRLARYVVWVKNWMGPKEHRYIAEIQEWHWIPANWPLSKCPTGYPPDRPEWMAVWLLIIADNTLHLTINYAALRWL